MLVLALALAALQVQASPPEHPPHGQTASAAAAQKSPDAQARSRLEEARGLLELAQAAEAARNLAETRALVREALEILDREPPVELDADAAGVINGLALVAWKAQAIELASAAWARVLAARERLLPEDHPHLLVTRGNLAQSMFRLGDLQGARALQEAVLESRERALPEDHPSLLKARGNLAATLYGMGDLQGARALQESVLESSERTLPEDHRDLFLARSDLALTMRVMGNLQGARVLQEAVLESSERTLPEDHPDLLAARGNLASTLYGMGDLQGARVLQEAVLEFRERTLPEDHPNLLRARGGLAVTMLRIGDHQGARVLQEAVLESSERTLPEDHPDLLTARGNLAATLYEMGDLQGARTLQEAVVESRERALPEDHPALLSARGNLAVTMSHMGDLRGARALEEAVLESKERTLPEDHPSLLRARGNLAATMGTMGDLQGARALEEAVLESSERTLPEDHPDLVRARGNLAATMRQMGDLQGARALQEAVLESSERTLPEDHPELLTARGNLAVTLGRMGDLQGERALQEAVLESRERTLPEGHPELLTARGNLAVTLGRMGDLQGARTLQEAVLEFRERTLPEDHPDLLRARGNLSVTIRQMGDLQSARELQEAALESKERTLPEAHPELLAGRDQLAMTLAGLEAWDELSEQTVALTRGIEERLSLGLVRSSRAAGESARAEADRIFAVLFYSHALESRSALARGAFELLETARHVASAGGIRLDDEEADAEVERLRWEASRLRGRLNDLVAAEGGSAEGRGESLATLVLERDRIEGRLRKRLLESGTFVERIDVEALAAALPEDGAAVGYRCYTRYSIDPVRRHEWEAVESLLAHVLRKDGTLQRIELGTIAELDAAVEAWRAAVGKPLARGMAFDEPEDGREEATARALAQRVLEPVLEALRQGDGPEVKTLFVCLDDALHLVPLDALPLTQERGVGLAGDVLDLRFEVSFSRLIQPRELPSEEGVLVALGGASFNAAPHRVDAEAENDTEPEAAAVEASTDRAGPGGQMFGPLRQTQFEAENISLLFEEIVEREPIVLMKKEATKDALERHGKEARWLHIATHGYFAPENVKSTADLRDDDALWNPMSTEERITGLAPMTLCGLALAGANRGCDSLGRVRGILTAEELAGWNLSSCMLAVLSACETNVGITRAGQGLQSLQAALHAAGARASITSLWKVDDELTRKLMEDFYTRLWAGGEPKAEALWNAKMALRKQGAQTRDWAGWVLVGDPD